MTLHMSDRFILASVNNLILCVPIQEFASAF